MSVLGQIAQRLKTDIAENVRATIDPSFGAKLDTSRFNAKAQDKANQRADTIRAENRSIQLFDANIRDQKEAAIRRQARANKLEDEDTRQMFTLQTAAATTALKNGSFSGNFDAASKILESESLNPNVRAFLENGIKGFGKSPEGIKEETRVRERVQSLSNEQTRILLQQRGLDDTSQRFAQNFALKVTTQNFKEGQALLKSEQGVTDVKNLVDSVNSMKGLFTDQELNGVLNAIEDASPEQALSVYGKFLGRANIKLKELQQQHAREATGKRDRASAVTQAELNEVRLFTEPLIRKLITEDEDAAFTFSNKGILGGLNNKEAEAEKEKLVFTVARIVKTKALVPRAAREDFIEEVFNFAIKHGIEIGEETILGTGSSDRRRRINPINIVRAWNESRGDNIPLESLSETNVEDEGFDPDNLTDEEAVEIREIIQGLPEGTKQFTYKGKTLSLGNG